VQEKQGREKSELWQIKNPERLRTASSTGEIGRRGGIAHCFGSLGGDEDDRRINPKNRWELLLRYFWGLIQSVRGREAFWRGKLFKGKG